MNKLTTLLLFLFLTLVACRGGDSPGVPPPLNVLPGLSTAEPVATKPALKNPESTSEHALLPTSTRTLQPADPATIAVEITTPELEELVETPAAYPAPADTPEPALASPAPPVVGEAASPYPSSNDNEPAVPIYGYRIINEYPHDPEAYTQGLVVVEDGRQFIEGTGLWGGSSVRRVDIETGEVTQFFALAEEYFGEGLTVFEDRIIQLTWKSNTGFIYDLQSFDLLGEFEYAHEGWGITHDDRQLIVSDGSAILRFWDPETLIETMQIQVTDSRGPVTMLNELEYVQREIWANVWQTDLIARIAPENGEVLGWIDLTGLYQVGEDASADDVLNGIAFDEQTGRLFVAGKRWPVLFEIELIPQLP